jgi:MoaA/NifB/PqqE/SkfB family radical SAM enzyme
MSDKLRFLFDHDMLLGADRVGPYSVEIDPTNHCPIGCSYCIWSEMRQRDPASLREDVFGKLIDDLIELRVSGIVFTGGGEPLRHPFTRKAIPKAKAGGICVGLFTSGVPLGSSMCSEILPHLSWIRFNVSAPDRESYKQIQGVDLFERVIENITNCVRVRKDQNLKVKLGIGCVLSQLGSDLRVVGSLVELAARLRLDFIQFKHDLNEIGTAKYEEWWEVQALPELRSVSQSNNSSVKIDYSERTYAGTAKSSCFIARRMAAIKADGTVVLCKMHRDTPSMTVGNINGETFKNIWLNAQRQQIIAKLEQEGCSSCCGYKDFNRHVLITRERGRSTEQNDVIPYATGIAQFGEDINFL